jgi:DNA-directed RNA polymerase specialized sigma24 family protein
MTLQNLDQIFQDNYRWVHRAAYGVTRRPEDAEDVVQTLFLRLLQRGFPPEGAFTSPLRRQPQRCRDRKNARNFTGDNCCPALSNTDETRKTDAVARSKAAARPSLNAHCEKRCNSTVEVIEGRREDG